MKIKELTTEYLEEKGFEEIVIKGKNVYEFAEVCNYCRTGDIVKFELKIDKTKLKFGNANNYPYFHDIKYYDEFLIATFNNAEKRKVAVRKNIIWKDNYCGD